MAEHILARLEVHSMRMVDLAFISVYLSDMDLFPAVNTVYGSYFGTSPPARACVAVDLPSNVRVQMDCIACTGASPMSPPRQALHVQGLSYWAPANIGPYSQAILVRPLYPPLMPQAYTPPTHRQTSGCSSLARSA
jgi:diphthine-ammonia ligase